VTITCGDRYDNISASNGMNTIPVALNSREKTEMIKNYQAALVTGASHCIGPFIVRALATEVYSACKDGLIGFTRVLRADYRKTGVSSSVLIPGSIGGAGTGARTLEEMNLRVSAMGKAIKSPPEDVARAVLKSIKRDKAEIVIMPGPGRLMKALMDLFPGMGPVMNQMGGVTPLMKHIADFRERQREQAGANAPIQQSSAEKS
jgi:hypothetical protein